MQLTAAVPASGATIALSSSNPAAAPVPPTIPMPGSQAWTQFQMQAGQVTAPTPVTLTATLNSVSASGQFTVHPPSLKSISTPSAISGGATVGAIVMLNGQAPAGGAVVTLSSNSPAASPPATATIAPGSYSVSVSFPTSTVTTNTTVTITATWNGVSVQSQITLTPQLPPASLTLNPTSTMGTGGSSFGTVTVASPPSTDLILQVTSSHPAVASVNSGVMIPAGMTTGGFNIFTTSVTVTTVVTISVTGAGVTRSATLTVTPEPPPPPPPVLSSFSVSPTSVTGGNPATGTVTLTGAAPAGGTTVTLGSNLPGAASVPPTVTVLAGATSANFTVTTFPVATTTVQLSATLNSEFLFAALTVNAPAPPGTPSLLSPANQATVAQPIAFDWTDAANAASYEIQIDDASTFTAPLIRSQTVTVSQVTITGLPAQQLWWRVRGLNSAGVAGSFSASRRFTAQAAPAAPTLTSLALNPTTVTGGASSQGTVTLSSAAATGGALVTLSSSNAGIAATPASVTVAAGATTANFTITTTTVAATSTATISATFSGVTRTATLTVNQAGSTPLPAPSLVSPANDARFSLGQAITFDWTDVAGAATYTLEIDDSSSFAAPLIVSQTVTASQFTTSTLPTGTMWWRVRANAASGAPGNWSTARRFEVRN